MIQKIDNQKGIAQFLVMAVMAFLALGIPTATKLVQENQENRSKAASEYISEETTTTLNPTRPLITYVPTKTPSPIPINTDQISFHHNFAPKDYSIRKIGSVLINDILIKTGGKKIDTATIVYCYTDLLKPDFNSVSGEQIAKVVSNKEIGNNCAEVKVVFNDKQLIDSLYQQYTDYVLSYKVTIVKYGRGMLGIDCTKSSLIDKNGEEIIANDPNCGYYNGTDFTLTDPLSVSPTPQASIPATSIKVAPTNLKLKVGQSQNLTYILTPSKSTDTVKWSVSEDGLVDIQKLSLKCTDSSDSKCLETPGTSHLQVTALKAGTVKIKLTTKSIKYTEVTVVIDKKPQSEIINGVCGPLTPSQITDNIDKEKPQLLCKSGKVGNFTKTADAYWWDCNGINGGESTGCGFDNPNNKIVNGACGSPKYDQLTPTTDKINPKLLCKSGKVTEFSKMTPNCSNPSNSTNCPPAFYSWKCIGTNGGKSVKCSIKSTLVPATGIKVTPTSLKLKVGQIGKISYVLTPRNTTDTVSSLIAGPKGLIRVAQTTPPCPNGANCAIATAGVRYYNITALKSGSVKITFKTKSGKSTSSTILINK